MNILLVEPDKRLARNVTQALEASGHTVALAADAQSAILAIDERRPAAIILELHLKKHNGVEFLYELRSYRDLKDIPVVVWTFAHHDKLINDETLLHELGIAEVLYKPSVTLQQVVRSVERIKQPLLS